MIAVIDYKAGNLTSVVKTLGYLGAETVVTQDPEVVQRAAKVVLPGVGHFRATTLLHTLGIDEAVRQATARGPGFLGSVLDCSGCMKARRSLPKMRGLGRLPGRVSGSLPSSKGHP